MQQAQIHKLATLARLELSTEVETRMATELGRVLDWVSALNAVDVSGIAPMAHPHDATARLRADEVTVGDLSAALEAIAPDMSGGLYRVPKVIE